MKKVLYGMLLSIMIVGSVFLLTGCGSEEISENLNSYDSQDDAYYQGQNVSENEEYDMPFTDKEFGIYSQNNDTVKIYKDGNKVHVTGKIDGYEFDFAFNLRDRYNIGETKKFNVYYQYEEKYSSSISFDELDDNGNSKAYTNLSINNNNNSMVCAGYGHDTTTSTILYK